METTSKITLEGSTAERFRKFSRKIAPSHSASMKVVLDFFEQNDLSPYEQLGPRMSTLEKRINKRMDSFIAILKNIERTELKPTLAMIQLLFRENEHQKREVLVEKKYATGYPPYPEEPLPLKTKEVQGELQLLLDKVIVTRTRYGGNQLLLDMTVEEYDQLCNKLKIRD